MTTKAKPVVHYTQQHLQYPPVIGKRADIYGVLDHPRLGACDYVVTSTVTKIGKNGTFWTRNSKYVLQ